MKKTVFILSVFMCLCTVVKAQTKVTDMPVDNTLEETDILYVIDKGTSSRQMTVPVFLVSVHDTANVIRSILADSLAVIRALAAGGGAFTKSGHYIDLTNTDDTLTIGVSAAQEKLNVGGSGYFYNGDLTVTGDGTTGGNVNAFIINFNQNSGSSGKIFSIGDDLYLGDNTNGWKKLSDLTVGRYLFRNNSTLYTIPSTYNFHFGGSTETTDKVKITGNLNVTGSSTFGSINNDVYFNNNVNLRLDEVSKILFSNTGSTDNLNLYPSSGSLAIQNDAYSAAQRIRLNPYSGAGVKTILDENVVGLQWDASGNIVLLTEDGSATFTGDSIHVVNTGAGLDYWIGQAVGTGAGGSFDGDTLEANYVIVADSIYPMGVGVDLSDVWWGGTSNGAMDTGYVENAWYGLVHALDNPMAYLNDTKEVEGHLELKVWYIDDKTGEPACQYGIKGLSPTEVATAFQINHEFMTRYVADHEARLQKLEQATKQDANLGLDVKFLIGLLVFVALMGLIVGFRR